MRAVGRLSTHHPRDGCGMQKCKASGQLCALPLRPSILTAVRHGARRRVPACSLELRLLAPGINAARFRIALHAHAPQAIKP
jgi:hypothetical protein